jgi:hypothetical protein
MVYACAQARTRLLRSRPRSSLSSRSPLLAPSQPSPPPSRAHRRCGENSVFAQRGRAARSQARLGWHTRFPARPTHAHAWQCVRPPCEPRRRALPCGSPSRSPHPSAHCGRVLTPSAFAWPIGARLCCALSQVAGGAPPDFQALRSAAPRTAALQSSARSAVRSAPSLDLCGCAPPVASSGCRAAHGPPTLSSHAARSGRWCVWLSQAAVEVPPMQQPTVGAAFASARPQCGARTPPPPPPAPTRPPMLCAGVSVVAMRRARALARCSARCAVLATLGAHAHALCSGADRRCRLRGRIIPNACAAAAAARPLQYAVCWCDRGCVASRVLATCSARCAVLTARSRSFLMHLVCWIRSHRSMHRSHGAESR